MNSHDDLIVTITINNQSHHPITQNPNRHLTSHNYHEVNHSSREITITTQTQQTVTTATLNPNRPSKSQYLWRTDGVFPISVDHAIIVDSPLKGRRWSCVHSTVQLAFVTNSCPPPVDLRSIGDVSG